MHLFLFFFAFVILLYAIPEFSTIIDLKGFTIICIFSTFTTSSPRPVSAPKYFISLYISFSFPYLLLKRHVWLSGNLGPVNSVHIFFFFSGSSSMCNWSLDNLLGRKWSLPPFPLFWHQTSNFKTHFINWNIVLQPLSQVWLFVLPWTVAQRPLCPTPSQIVPQDHVLWIFEAIQTSQTLLLIAPPAFNIF